MDLAQNQAQPNEEIVLKLKQKVMAASLPPDVAEKIHDELARVELIFKTKDFNPELDHQINYINFICELPWNKVGQDVLDLSRAKQILNKNHYGLEPIKERILE